MTHSRTHTPLHTHVYTHTHVHTVQVLVDENADLRRQLGLSKQTEEELARRNNVYQRTIKSLVGT
jgi:predicted metal-dependent phosphotriesterase family hydrolase